MAYWFDYQHLYQCWLKIKQKKAQGGLDNRSVNDYARWAKKRLKSLSLQLEQKKYTPEPGKRIFLKKTDGGKRCISLGTVEDKIVQMAVKETIEPLFEKDFLDSSYAYRPGRGHRRAIHRVQMYIDQNLHWITTCDIDNFFDSINHDILMQLLTTRVQDVYILELIQMWLKIGSFLGDRYIESREGVPQGGVISPLLSNIYLHSFDMEMKKRKAHYVRYADDFVILERDKQRASAHYAFANDYLVNRLQLTLNKIEPSVFHLSHGFIFPGMGSTHAGRLKCTNKLSTYSPIP